MENLGLVFLAGSKYFSGHLLYQPFWLVITRFLQPEKLVIHEVDEVLQIVKVGCLQFRDHMLLEDILTDLISENGLVFIEEVIVLDLFLTAFQHPDVLTHSLVLILMRLTDLDREQVPLNGSVLEKGEYQEEEFVIQTLTYFNVELQVLRQVERVTIAVTYRT